MSTLPGRTSARINAFRAAFPFLLIGIVTFLSFLPSLSNGFVNWDDPVNFLNNPNYRGLGWDNIRWMFSAFHLGHFIPVTWLSLGLDYTLWGMKPFGYHLTNVLLHVANAALAFAVLRSLVRASGISPDISDGALSFACVAGSLLFAIHPLRVESVAWVTERRDVLSGFFYLTSLLFYLRYINQPRRSLYWISVLAFALMALSRANAATLLATLIIVDVYPLKRFKLSRNYFVEKAPFIIITAAAMIVMFFSMRTAEAFTAFTQTTPIMRLAFTSAAFMLQLQKTFWPAGLSPVYSVNLSASFIRIFIVNAALPVAITVAAFLPRRRWPIILAAWLHFVITALPAHLSVNTWSIGNDRYSYLSSLAWSVLLSAVLLRLSREKRFFPAAAWVTAGILVVLGIRTQAQCRVWKNSETLWRHAVRLRSHPALPYEQLAGALTEQGRIADVAAVFQEGLTSFPRSSRLHYSYGVWLHARGKNVEAREQLRQSAALNPAFGNNYQELAALDKEAGKWDEALHLYSRAAEMDPRLADSWAQMGFLSMRSGSDRAAEDYLRRAIALRPDDDAAQFNLGVVVFRQGRPGEAAGYFRNAVRLVPSFDAYLNLAAALTQSGDVADALNADEQALKLRPQSAEARLSAAINLLALGRTIEAVKLLKQALTISPDFAAARECLSTVQANNKEIVK